MYVEVLCKVQYDYGNQTYQVTSCSQSLGTRELCTWGCTWIKKQTVSAEGQRRQDLGSSSRCCSSLQAVQGPRARASCSISCGALPKAMSCGQLYQTGVASVLRGMVHQKPKMTLHMQEKLEDMKSKSRMQCHLSDNSFSWEGIVHFHISVERPRVCAYQAVGTPVASLGL